MVRGTPSRIVRCGSCKYSLIAERKKGHVYYRCHNRPFKTPAVCPSTCIREEDIDESIVRSLAAVDLSEQEIACAATLLAEKRAQLESTRGEEMRALRLRLEQNGHQLSKLTDLVVEGTVDKDLFSAKQQALLIDKRNLQERLAEMDGGALQVERFIENTVELAKSPSFLYRIASPEKRRELVKTLMSNLTVSGKKVDITLALPFRLIADRSKTISGGPTWGTCRTWEDTLYEVIKYVEAKHYLRNDR
jgi:hypothetical protein